MYIVSGAPSRRAAVGAAIEGPRDRAALDAKSLPGFLRRDLVDGVASAAEHDAIGLARGLARDLAVQDVGEHQLGSAVERIAVAGAAGDVFPELIAGVEHDH